MTGRFPRQFGKYVLLKPLAKGGMGEIYLAAGGEVGGFEKLCVIKKVITEKLDRTKSNRFLDEAKVVLRLSHSALVNTFDAGEVNGEFYIAMELIEGKDLREVWNRCVRTRQRIPLDVALHVVREVARALAYVHGYGDLKLVHRDVAPPNILLAYVGDVKLTDFGLARSVLKQEHTAPGVVFGRAAYLSPEQARGEMADARTDVYTLGIVLWELLTGQQFLQLGGLDPAAALALVRHPRLVAPSTRAPWITPALDQVALRALASDRERRFQSAEELRNALTTVIAEIAPTADSARVADFLQGIYAETIADERAERERFLKDEIPTFRAALARGVRFDEPAPLSLSGSSGAAASAAGEGAAGEGVIEPARPRRSTPVGGAPLTGGRATASRLPGMPDPGERGRASDAPAFLTAFQAESARATRSSLPSLAAGNGHGRAATAAALDADGEPDAGPAGAQAPMILGKYRVGRAATETPGERLHQGVDAESNLPRMFHFYRGVHRADAAQAWKKAIRAAARVRHPHIAELHEAMVSDKGRPVAVHESIAGLDLGTLLSREQRFDPALALRLAREICEGLVAAHAASCIHGGLRPACVFLDTERPRQAVKLLGFGVTRLFGLHDRPLAALVKLPTGILEYLAPETLRGEPLDVRGDLYGLGALLYEMVTGVPPYAGSREAVERKKQAPPQSPRFFRPDLSVEIEELILRLCAPEPSLRPASAAVVLEALAPLCQAAGPGDLPGAGESDQARRRARRQAAFGAIAYLSGEVTAGPTLLEAMLSGAPGGTSGTHRPPVPPPVPPPGGPFPSGSPVRRPTPSSSILTSAVGTPDGIPGQQAPSPRPALGALLAHYGLDADPTAQKKRVRTLAALIVVAAVAVGVMIKMFGGGPPARSGPPRPPATAPAR